MFAAADCRHPAARRPVARGRMTPFGNRVMEKRVLFRSPGCPGCCSRRRWPSSCVFFFWPAGQALLQSCSSRTRSALREFVGLENFQRPVRRPGLPRIVQDHGVLLAAGGGAAASRSSLLLAVFADRVVRGATIYKTLLIWPYAVAPAVAGVLWLFMFAPTLGVVAYCAARASASTGTTCSIGNHAMALIVMAAVWKQISYNFLFFLAGLQSIPQVADRGGGHRRRRRRGGASGPSSSRCCRPPPSSCW